jgi:hypothetical protein
MRSSFSTFVAGQTTFQGICSKTSLSCVLPSRTVVSLFSCRDTESTTTWTSNLRLNLSDTYLLTNGICLGLSSKMYDYSSVKKSLAFKEPEVHRAMKMTAF